MRTGLWAGAGLKCDDVGVVSERTTMPQWESRA